MPTSSATSIGLRRGRRDPEKLRVGDTLDFWRVEAYEPNHRLRLRAEMNVPGRAWLEFEVSGDDDGSHIRQTATFDPIGLFQIIYWYSVWPLHQFVFADMLRNISRVAEGLESTPMKSQEPQSVVVS